MAAPGRAVLLAAALLFVAFFPSASAASSYPASELLLFFLAPPSRSLRFLRSLISYSASGGRDCGQARINHGVGGGQAAVVAQIGRHQDG